MTPLRIAGITDYFESRNIALCPKVVVDLDAEICFNVLKRFSTFKWHVNRA